MVIKRVIFPQANSISVVVILLTQFSSDDLKNKDKIASYFNIVKRQSQYYTDAFIFLGFMNNKYELTESGKKIRSCETENEFNVALRNTIVNKTVFKEIYAFYLVHKKLPKNEYIARLIREYYQLSLTTSIRRASTVVNWMKWVIYVEQSL